MYIVYIIYILYLCEKIKEYEYYNIRTKTEKHRPAG